MWVQGGNFSTNYVELGGGIRFGDYSSDPQHHWKRALDVSGGIQLHHNVVGYLLFVAALWVYPVVLVPLGLGMIVGHRRRDRLFWFMERAE